MLNLGQFLDIWGVLFRLKKHLLQVSHRRYTLLRIIIYCS